ncbi:PH domain-containing protein [Gracilibacillus massiliensis]|uniref:PH domain-containing protein n=1 Tax=Gracilibacillus massiliensis TaxID=1564956 RepID=UPI00097BEFBB|nr:PH domain-containing protein [Gracilibacillus massiliensis]
MRYHPLTILFKLYQLIKNSFFIIIILYVIQGRSDFWLYEYGRYAYIVFIILRILYITVSWWKETYQWDKQAFHLKKGVFVRNVSTIPFNKIQNVTRQTTLFHKIFRFTSVSFETAMDGADDTIKFDVVTKKHASFLTNLVQKDEAENTDETDNKAESEERVEPDQETKEFKTIHFEPTKRELWKASFTSLSFLAIIPITAGLYDYVEPFLPKLEGFGESFLQSKWLIFLLSLIAVIIAVSFGVIRTFARFGKYKISSNERYIYIDRGILNESNFAIEKRKVQGLQMRQTFMKRLFGLTEVTLISSASPGANDDNVNVNSLYPFLPISQAYSLIEQLLPEYQLKTNMTRLPKKALLVKLLRPSYVWLIATALLIYFKPKPFDIDIAWWIYSFVLLGLIILQRILDYVHTKYRIDEEQVQWWQGGLTTQMFVTKRQRIIEIATSQSLLQKLFGAATLQMMNRSTPVHTETIVDVPIEVVRFYHQWYKERKTQIKKDENG